ncbi:MAG: hydrogenase expression/formation protein HypE [Lachnospiraceae bacterium]|nr:hydrogenase expression/formation protein HypE [Lachnospiraceae bacterium]
MDRFITLDHGSGGKKTSELISNVFVPAFRNEALEMLGDGAVIPGKDTLVFSTDSFVVSPCFFPGGDIGKLAVCGTVNDVSMSGGEPKFLSLSAIIEEGFPMEDLEKVVASVKEAAQAAGVSIVTGDTKVVEKGKGDGIYLNTSGIGFLRHRGLSPERMRKGDAVIISGTVGDHGTAVMLARNPGLMTAQIKSDCAPLNHLAASLAYLGDDVRVMRDPTRGGLATTLCEFVEGTGLSIELDENLIPVDKSVKSACDILGLDPLYAANEGKMIAVVSPEKALEALDILKRQELGKNAAVIGTVTDSHPGRVIIKTAFGGTRIAAKLSGAQLPRIC